MRQLEVSANSDHSLLCSNFQFFHYSVTSSARTRIDRGTSRPSALAVLRFTTISNLVGDSVGEQTAFSDSERAPIDRRYVVSGRRRYDRCTIRGREYIR